MMTERHFMDPRRSGRVLRYHTYPTLQAQTVGEHTWQVMRILWAIWPEVPRHVLQHALVHDCGELRVGDVPYNSKRLLDGMEAAFDKAETEAVLSMCAPWGLPAPPPLADWERATFKLAELIEMMEFGLTEVNLGNRYAELIVSRCAAKVQEYLTYSGDSQPTPIPEPIIKAARSYVDRRRKTEEQIRAVT